MTLYATYELPTAPTTDRLARLTERERDVLRLIAEGRSNAGIAAELYLAGKTVESICSQIFRKLDLEPSQEMNRRVLAVLTLLRADWTR